jgi:hypothetical protein
MIKKASRVNESISPAAARMRVHRARRREGLRAVQVLLREGEIDALIQLRLLEKRSRNDPSAVVDALHLFLDRTFYRVTRNAARIDSISPKTAADFILIA